MRVDIGSMVLAGMTPPDYPSGCTSTLVHNFGCREADKNVCDSFLLAVVLQEFYILDESPYDAVSIRFDRCRSGRLHNFYKGYGFRFVKYI